MVRFIIPPHFPRVVHYGIYVYGVRRQRDGSPIAATAVTTAIAAIAATPSFIDRIR